VLSRIPEELVAVMECVPINQQEAVLAIGLFSCLIIKDLEPVNPNLVIRPSLLRIPNAKCEDKMSHKHDDVIQSGDTHDALSGLFWAHFT
jgi:hypothetical protein